MNRKKLLSVGILALIVIGCILAAGCTSTEPAETDLTADTAVPQVSPAGTWTFTEKIGDATVQDIHIFNKDGTGKYYGICDNQYMLQSSFTWKQTGSDVAVLYNGNANDAGFTLSSDGKELVYENGSRYTKTADFVSDEIIGTWVYLEKDADNLVACTVMFKGDGTGTDIDLFKDNTIKTYPFTWKKDGDTYKVTYSDGDKATFTLNKPQYTLTYTDDDGKIPATTYEHTWYADVTPVYGVWEGDDVVDGNSVTCIGLVRIDGTGAGVIRMADGTEIPSTFTWAKNGDGYTVRFTDGSEDQITYDAETDELVYSDGTRYWRR